MEKREKRGQSPNLKIAKSDAGNSIFEMKEVDDSYTPKEVKLSGPDVIQLDMFAIAEVER